VRPILAAEPPPPGRLPPFERTASSARYGPLLTVQGPLEEASSRRFTAELLELETFRAASLTVDLREVGYIDAAALDALRRAARRCRACGRGLRVVCAPGPVERLVRLTLPGLVLWPASPIEPEREGPARAGHRPLAAAAS
jgi:anti-anti-sigma factor